MRKLVFGVLVGVLCLASSFISFPVFADETVDIEIIEVIDDGSGDYKPWEDITDAMPGESYSLIPRVMNHSDIETYVYVCVTGSGKDAEGQDVAIPDDIFLIDFKSGWTKRAGENCYDYGAALAAGAITTPLFDQVTINGEIGNEFQNGTFSLTLTAVATSEEPAEPDEPVVPDEPEKPNTGFYTFIASATPVFSAAVVLVIIATTLVLIFKRKN